MKDGPQGGWARPQVLDRECALDCWLAFPTAHPHPHSTSPSSQARCLPASLTLPAWPSLLLASSHPSHPITELSQQAQLLFLLPCEIFCEPFFVERVLFLLWTLMAFIVQNCGSQTVCRGTQGTTASSRCAAGILDFLREPSVRNHANY